MIDIVRSVDEENKFWQDQIDNVQNDINVAYSDSGTSTVVDDSYLQSLYAQVDEMENEYQSKVNHLEDLRWELENKVNTLYSDDPAQHIYEEIDRLYDEMNQVSDGSHDGNNVDWNYIDQLQQAAWEMEQDLQDRTRALEDQLWTLDDALQLFYRNAEVENRDVQAEMNEAFQSMQTRRYEPTATVRRRRSCQ